MASNVIFKTYMNISKCSYTHILKWTLPVHFVMPMLQEDNYNCGELIKCCSVLPCWHAHRLLHTPSRDYMGGHCKHQSALARIFGHNDSFLHGLSTDTRKLYNQIAAGEFFLCSCLVPHSVQYNFIYMYNARCSSGSQLDFQLLQSLHCIKRQ